MGLNGVLVHNNNGGGNTAPTGKTLQTGGRTFKQQTANELNRLNGTNYHRGEFGGALEAIKDNNLLPPDFHQTKILDTGDIIHTNTGENLGNLFQWL